MKKILQHGVTLIELAVVLAIVAILLSTAAPSFSAWIQNVQIRTATESIQNGLQLARAEAIRRNRNVMFWLTAEAANPPTADWLVGCENPFSAAGAGPVPEAPGDCPGSSTGAAPVNWIQHQAAADQQTALPQVTTTPAGASVVTFNSLGMVTANVDGTASITRIDVTNPAMAGPRALRMTIGGGQIRMCDPQLNPATDPRGC